VIFCDWLDVTFPPGTGPYPELNALLIALGFRVQDSRDRQKWCYRPPNHDGKGLFAIWQGSLWDKVSISGVACAELRAQGAWLEVLTILADQPHTVTRVDATMDLPLDGADLFDSMRNRYPESVNLSRKALSTSIVMRRRPDGRDSGTWYAGYKSKARLTAKVYDKAWEVLCNTGREILPCGRIEITAKGDYGATLRDAAAPDALFWEGASPAILQAPEGVPVRSNVESIGWKSKPREFEPAAVLRRRVEYMAELDALASVADSMGPSGREYLLQLLRRRISTDQPRSSDSAPDVPAASACA
jgi:hypothetical protein